MKKTYRNAERTKRMIRQAFSELLQEKHTMEGITISELAARADIAKSTFYNHYTDIYAVAEEFENELIGQLFSAIDDADRTGTALFEEHMHRLTHFLQAHEEVYRSALLSPDTRFFVEKLKRLLAKRLSTSYVFPFTAEAEKRQIEIAFYTNACVDILCDYYRGAFHATLDEVVDTLITLLKRAGLPA